MLTKTTKKKCNSIGSNNMRLKDRQRFQKQIEQDCSVSDEIKDQIKQHKKSFGLGVGTICLAIVGLGLCSVSLTTKMKEAFSVMPSVFVDAIQTIELLAAATCITAIVHSIKGCHKEQKSLNEIVQQVSNDKIKEEFEKRNSENVYLEK